MDVAPPMITIDMKEEMSAYSIDVAAVSSVMIFFNRLRIAWPFSIFLGKFSILKGAIVV